MPIHIKTNSRMLHPFATLLLKLDLQRYAFLFRAMPFVDATSISPKSLYATTT